MRRAGPTSIRTLCDIETRLPRHRVTDMGDHLPERYFREVENAFLQEAARVGVREMSLLLAGRRIRIRAAGDGVLARIASTLAHLETGNEDPVDFTICCWDENAAPRKLRLPTRRMTDQAVYCCIPILTDPRFRTFYIEWLGILTCVDIGSNTAYCSYADAERLLMYEISAPLRPIFNIILNQAGMQMVHASAVGGSEGSLLFAGPPGSGKSTLAVLCLQDGLSYQADDICVLGSEQQPRSLSLYNIAKLRDDALPRFESLHPILRHFQEEHDEKKSYFYVQEHFPAQVLKEAPVRGLILPHVTGESSSRLERAAPLEAVRGLISWTIKEIPKSDALGERLMLQSLTRIPAYHLHVGCDDGQTLSLIRSLLE